MKLYIRHSASIACPRILWQLNAGAEATWLQHGQVKDYAGLVNNQSALSALSTTTSKMMLSGTSSFPDATYSWCLQPLPQTTMPPIATAPTLPDASDRHPWCCR
ncbi:hypothetical protein MRX96_038751 [Rhipicephalus microplus]